MTKKAYRGHIIYSNLTHDWFIEKDGAVIYCGFSENECRKQVDATLQPKQPLTTAQMIERDIPIYAANFNCSLEKARRDVEDEYGATDTEVDAFYERGAHHENL